MYQTQQALISHLESADLSAKEIKEYAGEFSGTSRQRVEYPAIFVLYREGTTLQYLPDLQYEIFFVSENKYHDNEKAKENALKIAQEYNQWIIDNRTFEDSESYYEIINLESANLTTLLNNHKWCILSLRSVTVQVNRQV